MTPSVTIPSVNPRGGAPTAPRRRCARHEEREAVARCVGCGGGFCRECVTEHAHRLYCAACFAASVAGPKAAADAARPLRRGRTQALCLTAGSLLILVATTYWLGRLLTSAPPELHEGTIWREAMGR
jgi:hypothetical protein